MPTQFLDILPDPTYGITDAGFSGGTVGQPFASVKFSQVSKRTGSRTISGKYVTRTIDYPTWEINITYNPMTRAQFDPIYNFLIEKRGSLKPFFVSLPQYTLPANSLFRNTVETGFITLWVLDNPAPAGSTSLEITDVTQWASNDYSTTGLPEAGDLFTLDSTHNSAHTKAYMVTHVETYNDYQTGNQPTDKSVRIHFTPGLQALAGQPTEVIFDTPLIRVIQKQNIRSYALGNNNLYSFSLSLKEAIY